MKASFRGRMNGLIVRVVVSLLHLYVLQARLEADRLNAMKVSGLFCV
ncbi:hypothetical protein HUB98_00045 [Paenibacillus barcinonensis]|uniref:Uncharacterized protein n=1 Tax=Paenibacillus barcinonensis TaxID=198119 RepID=A0ABX6PY72_PAEBA|nr:hypothetical protein [Paenibacillus barcinonensis]QKS54866.1 hypothetical protein HUB98_00045 [Paenibacillus barcinonensis]